MQSITNSMLQDTFAGLADHRNSSACYFYIRPCRSSCCTADTTRNFGRDDVHR